MSPWPVRQFAVVFSLVPATLPLVASGGSAVSATACSRSPGPVRSTPGVGKRVALTFDDGPTKFASQVLRILRQSNVRATFFVTGRAAAARPAQLRQLAAEGHLMAGHTPTITATPRDGGRLDPRLHGRPDGAHEPAVQRCRRPAGVLLRPAGGYSSSGTYDAVRAMHTAVMMWSIDTEDWKQPGATTREATRLIVGCATAGAAQTHPLVLFHDGKASHEPESQVSSNRSNTVAACRRSSPTTSGCAWGLTVHVEGGLATGVGAGAATVVAAGASGGPRNSTGEGLRGCAPPTVARCRGTAQTHP